MAPSISLRRCFFMAIAVAVSTLCCVELRAAQISFDLPDTIECRDVTPPDFAASHPTLKVIEAKLRISARVIEGDESEIVDFLYIITSPDKRLRIQDYLPNTTLESQYERDRIEVTEASEDQKGRINEARVAYKVFALGTTGTKSSKKSESNRYKQIAPKALVLSSGTTDREHGVFYRLRPSKDASLEGAKEFTFLAVVSRSWRGDWCTVSCAARANKKSFFSSSVVPAGVAQTQIGLHLVGDAEAASLAEELRRVQETHAAVLAAHMANDGAGLMDTMYSAVTPHRYLTDYSAALCGIFGTKRSESRSEPADPLEEAQQAVSAVQDRLRHLAE